MDDLATIIFSSGSTGEPKGVMLSHFNIDANEQGASQVLHLYHDERVLGNSSVLPFVRLSRLLARDVQQFGHHLSPSPLDVAAIGELVLRYRITFLVTTPTFLQLYQRRCTPEQFSSLRVVLTGAEKLPARLVQAFEDRFGIGPIEALWCHRDTLPSSPSIVRTSEPPGTTNRPHGGELSANRCPGVSVKIVDPDSFCLIAPRHSWHMLLVGGPNVMRRGTWDVRDLTANALRDGWYITGDIAMLDEDGFLTITDRLLALLKIGGEMVPHGRVEGGVAASRRTPTCRCFAVTGIPDEKKGEQLAVLHTLDESRFPTS